MKNLTYRCLRLLSVTILILLGIRAGTLTARELEYQVTAVYQPQTRSFSGKVNIAVPPECLDNEGTLYLELYPNRYRNAAANPNNKNMRRLYPFHFNPGYIDLKEITDPRGKALNGELIPDRQNHPRGLAKIYLPQPIPSSISVPFNTVVPERLGLLGRMDNALLAFYGFYPLVIDARKHLIIPGNHHLNIMLPAEEKLIIPPGKPLELSSVANENSIHRFELRHTATVLFYARQGDYVEKVFTVQGIEAHLIMTEEDPRQLRLLQESIEKSIYFFTEQVGKPPVKELYYAPFNMDRYLALADSQTVIYHPNLFRTFNYFQKFHDTALAEQTFRLLFEASVNQSGESGMHELLHLLSRYLSEEYALKRYKKIPDATRFFNGLRFFVEVEESDLLPDFPYRDVYFNLPLDEENNPYSLRLLLDAKAEPETIDVFKKILRHNARGHRYFRQLVQILRRTGNTPRTSESVASEVAKLPVAPGLSPKGEEEDKKPKKIDSLLKSSGVGGSVDARGLGLYFKKSYELSEYEATPWEALPSFIPPRYVRQPFRVVATRSRITYDVFNNKPKFQTDLSLYRGKNVRDHFTISGLASLDLLEAGLGYTFEFGKKVYGARREFALTPKILYRYYIDVDKLPGEKPEIYAAALDFGWDTIEDHFYFLNDYRLNLNVEVANSGVLGDYDYEKIELSYQHNFRPYDWMAFAFLTQTGVFADFPPSFIIYGYHRFLKAVPPGDRDDNEKRFLSFSPKVSFPVKDRLWVNVLRVVYIKRVFLNAFWEGGVLSSGSFASDTIDSLRHDAGPEVQFDCDFFGVAPGVLIVGAAIPARETSPNNSTFYITVNGSF